MKLSQCCSVVALCLCTSVPAQRILVHALGDEADDLLGSDVRSAGDVNGDGTPDVLAIAPGTFGRMPYVRVVIVDGKWYRTFGKHKGLLE
jgi:hypothetical protein